MRLLPAMQPFTGWPTITQKSLKKEWENVARENAKEFRHFKIRPF